MPSIRIFSDDRSNATVGLEGRQAIAQKMRARASEVLNEDPSAIEAIWLHPFEADSAQNALPYSVDIEFSAKTDEQTRDQLARSIGDAFMEAETIPAGTDFGVWIKTPCGFFWYQYQK